MIVTERIKTQASMIFYAEGLGAEELREIRDGQGSLALRTADGVELFVRDWPVVPRRGSALTSTASASIAGATATWRRRQRQPHRHFSGPAYRNIRHTMNAA
jgi:hypothetical protein